MEISEHLSIKNPENIHWTVHTEKWNQVFTFHNMKMDQLVDILAQKTGKFTQLLVYKDFGKEYKEYKEAIQKFLQK